MLSPFILAVTVLVAQSPRPDSVRLDLERAVQLALEHNLELVAARATTNFAEAGTQRAAGAFDPQLRLGYDGNWLTGRQLATSGDLRGESSTGALGTGVSGLLATGTAYQLTVQTLLRNQSPLTTQAHGTEYDNTLGFVVTQPLLRGFGVRNTRSAYARAQLLARAAAAQLERTRQRLVADIEFLFHDLVQRDAQTAVAVRSLRRAQELLERNKGLLALRKISEIDLTTSQLGVISRESALLDAQQARADALERLLATIYGAQAAAELRRSMSYVIVVPKVEVPSLPTPEAAEAQALAQRIDVTAVRLLRDDSQEGARFARNAQLPDLGLTLGYSASLQNAEGFGFSTGRLQDLQNRGWRAGFVFELPTLNRAARGARAQADAQVREDDARLENTANAVRTEVRSAVRAVTTGVERLQRAQTALALAQRQYEGEAQRLKLGLSDPFRLLQIEEQATVADLSAALARTLLADAITQYQLAMGIILEKYPAASY